jgi:hypothetical protein
MLETPMTDLDIAKTELYRNNLTLAIVKNGAVVYSTKSHRISGFLEAIEKCGPDLQRASMADLVVGKAVALLCVYAGIREVFAGVLSRKAMAVLKQNNVVFSWNEVVDNVLDTNKSETCPFEKAAKEISDPQKAYPKFKALLNNL